MGPSARAGKKVSRHVRAPSTVSSSEAPDSGNWLSGVAYSTKSMYDKKKEKVINEPLWSAKATLREILWQIDKHTEHLCLAVVTLGSEFEYQKKRQKITGVCTAGSRLFRSSRRPCLFDRAAPWLLVFRRKLSLWGRNRVKRVSQSFSQLCTCIASLCWQGQTLLLKCSDFFDEVWKEILCGQRGRGAERFKLHGAPC